MIALRYYSLYAYPRLVESSPPRVSGVRQVLLRLLQFGFAAIELPLQQFHLLLHVRTVYAVRGARPPIDGRRHDLPQNLRPQTRTEIRLYFRQNSATLFFSSSPTFIPFLFFSRRIFDDLRDSDETLPGS